MFQDNKPTIKDIDDVLKKLKTVKRPDGDNEGEPANSPDFYDNLSEDDKKIVDNAENTIKRYIKDSDGNPNNRAIGQMNKRGYQTNLGLAQYGENGELSGSVSVAVDKDDADEYGDDKISLNVGDE